MSIEWHPIISRNPGLQCTQSSSSFALSVPSTSEITQLVQTAPTAGRSNGPPATIKHKRGTARRSLDLLGQIPKDFSSLIRSRSSSTRRQPSAEHTEVPSDYAHVHTFKEPSRSSIDMFASRKEDERSSRKPKSENRLYNFLTRSRSRSRSKNARPPSIDLSPIPDLPINGHARHFSLGQTGQRPSPDSKPPSRIQSRPLSSTTTATNTTITPGTPRPKKRPPSTLPVTPLALDVLENGQLLSRPSTPKASSTRKKLHHLFGIPLSPRKSSFGSRTSSPGPYPNGGIEAPWRPSQDVSGEDHDSTPKPRRSSSPHPNTQSPSPVPRSSLKHLNLSTTNTNTTTSSTSTSTSSKIDHFFRGLSGRSDPNHPQMSASAPSAPVSGPLKRSPTSSTSHRRSIKPTDPSHDPTAPISPTSPTSVYAPQPRSLQKPMMPPPPKITHTPATPQRPTTSPPQMSQRKDSADSGRSRGMGVVEEGSRGNGKGKEREVNGNARGAPMKLSSNARSTKHGSFDFERPGWGTGVIQRSGSGGTAGTGNGWGRGDSIRQSALGPGMAGVGTLQRELSLKRMTEEQAKTEERRHQREREHHRSQRAMVSPTGSLLPDNTGGSSSTTHTTDSKAKASRRGIFGGGNGRGRLTTQHGPFSFEPAVPSPTLSTGSANVGSGWGAPPPLPEITWADRQKERERVEREKEKGRHREKDRRTHRGDRAPVPVPAPVTTILPNTNAGHRSGTKGRSLDLGLGLAWASSKVREDALLPNSAFLGRSSSASSSAGLRSVERSRGGSFSSGNSGRWRQGEGQETETLGHGGGDGERTKVGREVADVFRSALDEDGFVAFKRYIHQFDARKMPFDGPNGIVAQVQRLLETAPDLGDDGKKRLLDSFVRIVLQNT